jgi:hypothetical protein
MAIEWDMLVEGGGGGRGLFCVGMRSAGGFVVFVAFGEVAESLSKWNVYLGRWKVEGWTTENLDIGQRYL